MQRPHGIPLSQITLFRCPRVQKFRISAAVVYCFREQQESGRLRLALDWALMSTSVYGSAYSLLASTGKVARTIAWASLLNDATRLFFENSTLKAYIETQPWGEDFVKTYYALSLGIDITSIAHGCLLAVKENAYKVRKVLVENHVSEKEVPQNTRLYVGRIEEQASYKGGADQILLPKDYPSEWIRTIRDLKTGKVYTFEEYMQITIK